MASGLAVRHLAGSAAALASAFLWAATALLWNKLGPELSPDAMNLGKGLCALVLFAATFVFTGFAPAAPRDWLILGLSGLLGVAAGDTLFFLSLRRLGPRRALLLTTLIPVLVALGARAFLGERIAPTGVLGICLCAGGVAWVMYERLPIAQDRGGRPFGVAWGLLSALSCAAAVLLAKTALAETPALEASFIRILVGTVGLAGAIVMAGRADAAAPIFTEWRIQRVLIPAACGGTYLGIWLSNLALRYTTATVATLLNSTSPLFIVLLAAIFLHEPVSPRTVAGTLIATAGMALLLSLG